MYVIGGRGPVANSPLAHVEKWTPRGWVPAPELMHARDAPAATVLDETVWVIGGSDADGPLSSVEMLPKGSEQWIAGPPIRTARDAAAAVTFQGKIYLLGGKRAADKFLSSVEVYDPAKGLWEEAPAMAVCRESLAAAVLDLPAKRELRAKR